MLSPETKETNPTFQEVHEQNAYRTNKNKFDAFYKHVKLCFLRQERNNQENDKGS